MTALVERAQPSATGEGSIRLLVRREFCEPGPASAPEGTRVRSAVESDCEAVGLNYVFARTNFRINTQITPKTRRIFGGRQSSGVYADC